VNWDREDSKYQRKGLEKKNLLNNLLLVLDSVLIQENQELKEKYSNNEESDRGKRFSIGQYQRRRRNGEVHTEVQKSQGGREKKKGGGVIEERGEKDMKRGKRGTKMGTNDEKI